MTSAQIKMNLLQHIPTKKPRLLPLFASFRINRSILFKSVKVILEPYLEKTFFSFKGGLFARMT